MNAQIAQTVFTLALLALLFLLSFLIATLLDHFKTDLYNGVQDDKDLPD